MVGQMQIEGDAGIAHQRAFGRIHPAREDAEIPQPPAGPQLQVERGGIRLVEHVEHAGFELRTPQIVVCPRGARDRHKRRRGGDHQAIFHQRALPAFPNSITSKEQRRGANGPAGTHPLRRRPRAATIADRRMEHELVFAKSTSKRTYLPMLKPAISAF